MGDFRMMTISLQSQQKGKSVVDYVCVPHDVFDKCKSFKVITVGSIVDNNALYNLISERSRLPDHSVLITEFAVTTSRHEQFTGSENDTIRPQFKLSRIPVDFTGSELPRRAFLDIVNEIEQCREKQENIDNIYGNLCNVIISEMNDRIPKYCFNNSKKRLRNKKPYWNDNLTNLWNNMRLSERKFIQCSGNRNSKKQCYGTNIYKLEMYSIKT